MDEDKLNELIDNLVTAAIVAHISGGNSREQQFMYDSKKRLLDYVMSQATVTSSELQDVLASGASVKLDCYQLDLDDAQAKGWIKLGEDEA
jgi:hypothetical protein